MQRRCEGHTCRRAPPLNLAPAGSAAHLAALPPSLYSTCRLVLEDEGARVTLCGDACPVGECVTGVVAAVRGHVLPNGDFEVTGCVFAGAPPQPPLPRSEDK